MGPRAPSKPPEGVAGETKQPASNRFFSILRDATTLILTGALLLVTKWQFDLQDAQLRPIIFPQVHLSEELQAQPRHLDTLIVSNEGGPVSRVIPQMQAFVLADVTTGKLKAPRTVIIPLSDYYRQHNTYHAARGVIAAALPGNENDNYYSAHQLTSLNYDSSGVKVRLRKVVRLVTVTYVDVRNRSDGTAFIVEDNFHWPIDVKKADKLEALLYDRWTQGGIYLSLRNAPAPIVRAAILEAFDVGKNDEALLRAIKIGPRTNLLTYAR